MPEMSRWTRSVLVLTWTLITACALPGCGLSKAQLGAIEKFSVGTTEVADIAAAELVQIRNDVIELRKGMMGIDPTTVVLDDEANDLDAALSVEELEKRLAAATALRRYGQLLHALAVDDQTGRLQAATTSFITSLRKVEGGVELSDAKAGAITGLVVAIGGLAIDHARARAIKAVVIDFDPALTKVVELMREGFDPSDEAWAVVLTETQRQIDNTLGRGIVIVKRDDPALGAVLEVQHRELQADANRRVSAFHESQGRIDDALVKLNEARRDLYFVIQSDTITPGRIDAFFTQVEELALLYKALRDD